MPTSSFWEGKTYTNKTIRGKTDFFIALPVENLARDSLMTVREDIRFDDHLFPPNTLDGEAFGLFSLLSSRTPCMRTP